MRPSKVDNNNDCYAGAGKLVLEHRATSDPLWCDAYGSVLFCYICADWCDNLSFGADATQESEWSKEGWHRLTWKLVYRSSGNWDPGHPEDQLLKSCISWPEDNNNFPHPKPIKWKWGPEMQIPTRQPGGQRHAWPNSYWPGPKEQSAIIRQKARLWIIIKNLRAHALHSWA